MEQLINAFGIDTKLIVIQIINFFLLAGALSYLLYKPVLKILKEREDTITQGVKDAEAAAQAKDAAEKDKQATLAEAHAQAQEVAQNAKSFAQEKADEILAQAQTKAQSVVENAHAKGEEIKVRSQKESEAEIAKIAILAAEKILREQKS